KGAVRHANGIEQPGMLRAEEVAVVGRNHKLRGSAAQAEQAKQRLHGLPQAKRAGQVGYARFHDLVTQGFEAVAVSINGVVGRQQGAALGVEHEKQAIEQNQRLLVEQIEIIERGSRLLAPRRLVRRIDRCVRQFTRAVNQRSHQHFERAKDAALECRTDALGMFATALFYDIKQASPLLVRLECLGAEERPERVEIAVAAVLEERFQVNLEVLLVTCDDVA